MLLSRLVLPPAPTEPPHVRKRAAVAIITDPHGDALFIRRAVREGDPWSGDMAFPGGRFQAGDPSLRSTAERETLEEVGMDLGPAAYVGALDCLVSPLREPDGTFGIFPFVYGVDSWPELSPNHEVAATHRLSLPRIFAGEGRGTFTYRGYGIVRELPCVRIDDTFIWGLTLRMLDTLAEKMAP